MMRKTFSATCLLALCFGGLARGKDCVQIISTNDLHGHLVPGAQEAGRSAEAGGGLATLGGYLAILRKHYPGHTLLIDAGDLIQGTLSSDLNRGASVVAAYNALGYQAVAVGNHEFDFGADALKERIGESRFPFLAANVFERATRQRPEWLAPSVLLTVGGVRVGIIGVATAETGSITSPATVKDLDFRTGSAEVAAEAAALRSKGAQLIVVAAHMGFTELCAVLDALPPHAVDVAAGGHIHEYVARPLHGVFVSTNGAYGESFGWTEACVSADGSVSTQNRGPVSISAPASFLGEPVVPSPAVDKVIQPFLDAAQKRRATPLGVTLAAALVRDSGRTCRLGQLVAEGLRRAVPGAQIGLMNIGGVRTDLPRGPLTFGDLFEALPFDERVVRLKLKGSQLRALLLAPFRSGHGFPQLAGARWAYGQGQNAVVLTDGTPVLDDGEYLVATNDFLAAGGDGTGKVVDTLEPGRRETLDVLVRDAVIAYLKGLPQPIRN